MARRDRGGYRGGMSARREIPSLSDMPTAAEDRGIGEVEPLGDMPDPEPKPPQPPRPPRPVPPDLDTGEPVPDPGPEAAKPGTEEGARRITPVPIGGGDAIEYECQGGLWVETSRRVVAARPRPRDPSVPRADEQA